MTLILFNKPNLVMCQFSAHPTRSSLADFINIPNIYPAGRLDADSEGLILLTDDGQLQHKIAHPSSKAPKTYIAQVEGRVESTHLQRLSSGINLGDYVTLPCEVKRIAEPAWLWMRNPPIRQRQEIPTDWLALTLREGKNRQVRHMTAAVGLPTLRLIRISIGRISLETHPLLPGEWQEVNENSI